MGKLRDIFLEKGIDIRDEYGFLLNPIDLLEFIYLRLTPKDFEQIQQDIYLESSIAPIFDEEREAGKL